MVYAQTLVRLVNQGFKRLHGDSEINVSSKRQKSMDGDPQIPPFTVDLPNELWGEIMEAGPLEEMEIWTQVNTRLREYSRISYLKRSGALTIGSTVVVHLHSGLTNRAILLLLSAPLLTGKQIDLTSDLFVIAQFHWEICQFLSRNTTYSFTVTCPKSQEPMAAKCRTGDALAVVFASLGRSCLFVRMGSELDSNKDAMRRVFSNPPKLSWRHLSEIQKNVIPRIESISLMSCYLESRAQGKLLAILAKCPNVTHFLVDVATDRAYRFLQHNLHMPKMETFFLLACPIPSRSFQSILKRHTALRTLSISSQLRTHQKPNCKPSRRWSNFYIPANLTSLKISSDIRCQTGITSALSILQIEAAILSPFCCNNAYANYLYSLHKPLQHLSAAQLSNIEVRITFPCSLVTNIRLGHSHPNDLAACSTVDTETHPGLKSLIVRVPALNRAILEWLLQYIVCFPNLSALTVEHDQHSTEKDDIFVLPLLDFTKHSLSNFTCAWGTYWRFKNGWQRFSSTNPK